MAENTDKTLRNKLIYQIFIRNYGEKGTFKKVEEDLSRIRDLGTDIIYFLPIHPIGEKNRKGTLGSPYAIRDYRGINPEYGTMEDFISLTEAIHEAGMKCMIDVVYNHTSPDSVLAAEHPGWFYHREDGSFGNRVGDWTDIIDLDYTNPELWDYQIETLKFWAQYVDGFRCDVAPLVPVEFWERARRETKKVRPGCIFLAESVEPGFILHLRGRGIRAHSDAELYRAFDILYDYDIQEFLTGYLKGKSSLQAYADAVNRQEYIYPDEHIKLCFLENHDQTRAAFLVPDKKALRNLTAFSFFRKGTAFLYAGQEFGVSHLPTLFDADPVSLIPEDGTDLTELIKILSKLKKNPAFTDSIFHAEAPLPDVLVAEHSEKEQPGTVCPQNGETKKAAVGIFSLKGKSATVPVPLPDGIFHDEISGRETEVFRGMIRTFGEPVLILPGKASKGAAK
ncbi:MAG: alpha-amylase [Lachnospiraceae bacterium]|nr:alpha-amylase [Lachnospiraceae bacterium]